MELISNDILRKGLGISKDTPIYYINEDIAKKAVEEVFQNDLDITWKIEENEMQDLVEKRPFDECVVILAHGKPFNDDRHRFSINHFTLDGNFRTFIYTQGEESLQNTTVRENFSFETFNIERDRQILFMNKTMALYSITPFSVKKNVVTLAEGRARKPGKAKKYKKQKFLYISGTYTNGVTKPTNGVRQRASYPITKVAGHPRYYRKNPETKGHDRNGNDVVGRYEGDDF